MSRRFLITCVVVATALFSITTYASELRIVAKVNNNPTIAFVPTNNSALNAEILSMLKSCGWFDMATAEKADYQLTAQVANNSMTFALTMSGAPIGRWRVPCTNPRTAAKDSVDTILKKLFNIQGICNTKVVFCADTAHGVKNLYTCDIDGKEVNQITKFNTLCVEPCWFPDGKSVGYTKYGKAHTDIIQTQLNPLRSRRLTSLPGLNVGVSISPEGKRMALIQSSDHMVDLYVKDIATGATRRLTRGRAVEASPCWSPDGSQICFVSDESGRPRIYTVNVQTGAKTQLPSVGNEAVTPDWSLDNKIVYATRVNGVYTLAVLDIAKKENTRATMVSGAWESPAWAPDNRQVICKRADGNRSSLFVVDTWTGKVRQLLATNNRLSMPAWSKVSK